MAKEFFKEHNLAYEEKNVATDAEAREQMIERSGQMGVPVIDIEVKIVIGFDQQRLRELLEIGQ